MDWKCIGYDIRIWPAPTVMSADAGEWDTADEQAQIALHSTGLTKNSLDLIYCADFKSLEKLAECVKSEAECVIVRIDVPHLVAKHFVENFGLELSEAESSESPTFNVVGIDICDVQGLFSLLHHPHIEKIRGTKSLFKSEQLLEAYSFSEWANFVDRGHSPTSLCRVSYMPRRP